MQYVWYFCEVNNGHYFDNVTELIIWWLKQLCIPIKVISFSLSFKRRVWFNSWFGLFISPFMEITFFFVFQPKQLHPSKMFYTFLRSCLIFLNSISSKAKGYLGKIRIFKNFFQSIFFEYLRPFSKATEKTGKSLVLLWIRFILNWKRKVYSNDLPWH